MDFLLSTQGSSFLATLGLVIEPRWGSGRGENGLVGWAVVRGSQTTGRSEAEEHLCPTLNGLFRGGEIYEASFGVYSNQSDVGFLAYVQSLFAIYNSAFGGDF